MKGAEVQQQMLRTMQRHAMFDPGDRILVGVSGGPDSVSLVRHLVAMQEEQFWDEIAIVHLNHHLRPDSCDADMEFVRQLGEQLNVSVYLRDINIRRVAKRNGESLEASARRERYRLFQETCEARRYNRIALAHIADDNAETVLFRILRGTGMRGLSGIPHKRPLVRGSDIFVVRPILDIHRDEVVSYLKQQELDYCIDSSNYQKSARRNQIRHHLIPQLTREFNPNLKEALLHLAGISDHAYALLLHEFDPESCIDIQPDDPDEVFSVPVETLKNLSTLQQTLVLECGIEMVMGGAMPLNREIIQSLHALLAGEIGPSGFHIAGGMGIWVEYENILVGRRASSDTPRPRYVQVPGVTVLEDFGVQVHIEEKKFTTAQFAIFKKNKSDNEEWLDADALGNRLLVRHWLDGDSFQPLGLKGTKKLQDFFVDIKIPQRKRGRVPLLLADDKIAWIVGHRTAHPFRITRNSQRVYHVRVQAIR